MRIPRVLVSDSTAGATFPLDLEIIVRGPGRNFLYRFLAVGFSLIYFDAMVWLMTAMDNGLPSRRDL